eukprot:7274471-Alexandrium_andersonii.AAC.1
MEESPEDELDLQDLARGAAQKLNPEEDVQMDDAVVQDITDFQKPEEPEDPERSEPSGVPGVRARGPQFRGDVTGAVSPP